MTIYLPVSSSPPSLLPHRLPKPLPPDHQNEVARKKRRRRSLPTRTRRARRGFISTGGAEGPLAAALQQGGIEEAHRQVDRLIGSSATKRLRRIAAPFPARRRIPQPRRHRHRAFLPSSPARHQRSLLRHAKAAKSATPSPHPPPTHALHRRTPARPQLRALPEIRAEMQQLFADLPEALANTLELSSRLEFSLNDLGYEFPRYPVPEGETMNSFLRERSWEGFHTRYGRAKPEMQTRARRQIEKELALIEKLKLGGYFLIVWDHRALLPGARHSCGPRIGRQQRRLLLPSTSPPWTRSAWNFCSSDSCRKNATSGRTSTRSAQRRRA